MGIIRIYRLTGEFDDEDTDFIEFNIPNSKTTVENAFINEIKFDPSDGVGNNQGAEQELGDQQALGLVEDVIKISGFISKRNGNSNDGQNALLDKMSIWESEPKINDDWELGRFGFLDADDVTENVTPDINPNTIALLWERIQWTVDFKGNRKLFDLYFRINRGDGT